MIDKEPTQEQIKLVLLELWENDNNVPDAENYRCTELDWFSQGIKDNIIAYIAMKLLGFDYAQKLLGISLNKQVL